jgi:ribonuclease III
MLDRLRQKQLQQFVQKLGLTDETLVQWELLNLALTHPTASATENYERLEFVGDAVVKLAAAEFLFNQYSELSEGQLSAIRSVLVSDRTLSQIALHYDFERYLRVGSSAHGDRIGQETRLAAAMESVLAALYLSAQSLTLIHPWLDTHLHEKAEVIRLDPTLQNYKGALQAWTQAHYQTLPEYRVREVEQSYYGDTGRFIAEVWFQERQWGEGKGQSKKAAEQAAAEVAFFALTHSRDHGSDRSSDHSSDHSSAQELRYDNP